MKKILGSIIIMCTLICACIIGEAATYKDVNSNMWYYKDLMFLSDKGIIKGFNDGTFGGGQTLNKDQYIKMLVEHKAKAVGNEYKATNGYWAEKYIDKAISLGILDESELIYDKQNLTTGAVEKVKNYNVFKEPCTREEACSYTIKMLNEEASGYTSYKNIISDYNSIDEKLKNDVLKTYSLGIINGFKDGTFKPEGLLSRAEATAIMSRAIDKTRRQKIEISSSNNEEISQEEIEMINTKYTKVLYNPDEKINTELINMAMEKYNAVFEDFTKEYASNVYNVKYIDYLKNYNDIYSIYNKYHESGKLKIWNEVFTASNMTVNFFVSSYGKYLNENKIEIKSNFKTSRELVYYGADDYIHVRGILERTYISSDDSNFIKGTTYDVDLDIAIGYSDEKESLYIYKVEELE